MSAGLPTREEIAARVAEWRLHEALGLDDGAAPATVLLRIAELRNRYPEAGADLDVAQEWLVARSREYAATGAAVRDALIALRNRYGPHVLEFLAARDHDIGAVVREAAAASDVRASILARVERLATALQELSASPSERSRGAVEAFSHPTAPPCPDCRGTSRVACPTCSGSGRVDGRKVGPAEVLAQMRHDPALLARVRADMVKQRVPSWITPEEFVEIFEVTGTGTTPCLNCHGSGHVPCPRSRTLVFPLPAGCRPGWILKATGDGHKTSFVRVRFG